MNERRLNRRAVLAGMATAAGVGALAACGAVPATGTTPAAPAAATAVGEGDAAPSEAPAAAASVTFMARGDDAIFAVFRQLKEAFAEVHPEIDVEILETPGDWLQKLQLMIASDTPPDCDFSSDDMLLNLCRLGVYQELDPFLEQDSRFNRDDFYAISLFNGTYEGKLYHLPYDGGSYAIVYNKDLLQADGIPFPSDTEPLTWDELLNAAIALTRDLDGNKPGEAGFDASRIQRYGFDPGAGWLWWAWAWWNGGELFDADWKQCLLDSPEAAEGIQWAADLGAKHLCSPSPAYQQSSPIGFFAGNVAMVIDGVWSNVRYRQASFDWDVAPLMAGKLRIPLGEYSGLSMLKAGKVKQEAYEWIWFGTSEEGQKIVSGLGQAVPARKALARTEVFLNPNAKPEHAQVYLDELESPDMRSVPYWPYFYEMVNIVTPILDPVWQGTATAQEAVAEIAPKLTTLAETGQVS